MAEIGMATDTYHHDGMGTEIHMDMLLKAPVRLGMVALANTALADRTCVAALVDMVVDAKLAS